MSVSEQALEKMDAAAWAARIEQGKASMALLEAMASGRFPLSENGWISCFSDSELRDFGPTCRLLLQRIAHEKRLRGQAGPKRFALWAHDAQWPPEGDWRCWLFMGGRGAGKTRAGAEWVRACVANGAARRVALVGPTLGDVREVMIEGPSGLRAVSCDEERPEYSVTRRRLVWPNGAEAFAFSAEDPDSLRGPQFDLAWCDEIGAWARDEATWDMLSFALRLGARPRVLATTTPRARALVKRLVRLAGAGGDIVVTRAATAANSGLSDGAVAALYAAYVGTRLARQELEGELVEDPPGALFTREAIERWRVTAGAGDAPYERVVVAVDPPAGIGRDACGIVAAGVRDGVVHVIGDSSARGLAPLDWARRAVALARQVGAGAIIAEANQGGEMVRDVLRMAGGDEPVVVKLRHARRSKRDRAEPVSVMYAKGEVRHVGVYRELEDELCSFGADGTPSPDRADALVWAVSELSVKARGVRPKVGVL